MSLYSALPQFERELKKLCRKYTTLEADFAYFQKILATRPCGAGKNFTILHLTTAAKIIKARLACRCLHKRPLRIIYAYLPSAKKIEFIEIYFKGNKANEDFERIKWYLKQH